MARRKRSRLGGLTRREIEALQWAAEGASVEEIGVAMGIASETVKAHLDSARYKLQALNRTHAIAKALRAGPHPVTDMPVQQAASAGRRKRDGGFQA